MDLYITGHEHNYERSKQLAFNGSTCPANPGIQLGTYNSNCVVGSTNPFIKGAGTIILTIGTGGDSHYSCGTSSTSSNGYIPQYFLLCSSASFGFVKFSVTGSSLSASFVASSGSYSDSFNIADFTIASVTSISFHKNCILQDTLTATALNGFISDITLSYTDPSGRVSLIFSPNPVNPQGTFAESMMTYHGNPEGTYVITVIGTSGVIVHSYLVTVTITPPGVCPVLPP